MFLPRVDEAILLALGGQLALAFPPHKLRGGHLDSLQHGICTSLLGRNKSQVGATLTLHIATHGANFFTHACACAEIFT